MEYSLWEFASDGFAMVFVLFFWKALVTQRYTKKTEENKRRLIKCVENALKIPWNIIDVMVLKGDPKNEMQENEQVNFKRQ